MVWNPNAGPNGEPGQWYDVYCGGVYKRTVFLPAATGGPPGTVVEPTVLAEQALASAPFPPISVQMSPPATREAVNFPIFLSLSSGFATVTATASLAGVTSTVTITPSAVTWDMGDSHSVTCAGAGVAYNPAKSFNSQLSASGLPRCGYKYSTSSANRPREAFQATVTIHYHATWTVTGAPGGGDLGPIDRSLTLPVTVGEIQILNN